MDREIETWSGTLARAAVAARLGMPPRSETDEMMEACLSFPGMEGPVFRPQWIEVEDRPRYWPALGCWGPGGTSEAGGMAQGKGGAQRADGGVHPMDDARSLCASSEAQDLHGKSYKRRIEGVEVANSVCSSSGRVSLAERSAALPPF